VTCAWHNRPTVISDLKTTVLDADQPSLLLEASVRDDVMDVLFLAIYSCDEVKNLLQKFSRCLALKFILCSY
jgi:hypothetical protein